MALNLDSFRRTPPAMTYVRRPSVCATGLQVALAPSVSAHSLCLRIRCGTPRPPCGRAARAFGAREALALATAGRRLGCPCRWPYGHPPGLYAFRGLLASALRAFPGSQRS